MSPHVPENLLLAFADGDLPALEAVPGVVGVFVEGAEDDLAQLARCEPLFGARALDCREGRRISIFIRSPNEQGVGRPQSLASS